MVRTYSARVGRFTRPKVDRARVPSSSWVSSRSRLELIVVGNVIVIEIEVDLHASSYRSGDGDKTMWL